MARNVRKTHVYRHVRGNVDLDEPLSKYTSANYHNTVCGGVFTLGYVRPDWLLELARVTRPSGIYQA
ncbi:hypothetical protein [Mesorhizobium temperatum]|uniref:Uncharacterized protein n=1 Tax=Mesorhizobium temperatum TaxID=241416 RepID=A0A271LLD6_9HYPH|nr:hypothetical protein [Mesorhizobium temperatum]PAQ08919.1 hypothetical protein CIT26_15120 [Mesorhizobium temperatum]